MDFFGLGRAMAALGGRDLTDEFNEVAGQIERSLFDLRLPQRDDIDIGARAAPARIAGGDYIDVVERTGRAPFFGIGESSGKSLPAALKALTLKYLLRGLVAAIEDDLARIVTLANVVICDLVGPDEFISVLACTFEKNARVLVMANAGHDPPLVYRAATGTVEQLAPGGLVLGVDVLSRYAEQRTAIEPGDRVILYTDGFTEARNASGEQFTEQQLIEGILDAPGLPPQALADALYGRIEAYTAGTFRDDASILVIGVR